MSILSKKGWMKKTGKRKNNWEIRGRANRRL